MGILTNLQPGIYYGSTGPHGEYQSIELSEIIKSFIAVYVGEGKICEKVNSSDVMFHAVRGLQELSYDTLRSTKEWEVVVPDTLTLVMPMDYVNYVKLSWSDTSGVERIIYPTSKTSNPSNVSGDGQIDSVNAPGVQPHGGFQLSSATASLTQGEDSDTKAAFKAAISVDNDNEQGTQFGAEGGRFGLNPEIAQSNGSFYIDYKQGKFHFGSVLAGKTLVLKYISDGIVKTGDASSIDLANTVVPKLAEEAIYKHILYGVLLARKDTPGGLLAQIKKERFAETRKAKIRLSNIKLEEIAQTMRGGSKMIKH
tara:strand:+ start:777 stop:1709 length:933 start_codon:yes stop_codon:yes gene_type:complete